MLNQFRPTSSVAVLQVPYDKGILVTANYGQMQSVCIEYNKCICYNSIDWEVYTKVIRTI